MNSRIIASMAMLAMLGTALPAEAATAQIPVAQQGTWINPHGSVTVKTGPCGDKLCGWIVWANATAQQDARDSGVPHLIGTELLQNYQQTSHGRWSGTVYVPDMGGHFSSTITPAGTTALQIKGCLVGGFICKSQVWRRVS
jgi:uncharacterized protein (DUF2147 family)